MATIQKAEDLAAALGQVIEAPDPVEALKAKGFTFSTEVQKGLAGAKPPAALSPQERARWVQKAKAVGPVRFNVGPVALAAAPALPAGEYDFVCAIRMELINEVLAALYAGFTWPHAIAPDKAGLLFPLDALKAFAAGIPEESNIQVGALNFTAAPTVSPIAGTERVLLHQPFSLDIDRVRALPFPNLGPQRTRVTALDGMLQVGLQVIAEFETPDRLSFVFDGFPADPGTPEAVRIEVSTASPLQPRSPQTLSELEREVNGRFNLAILTGAIRQAYSICPEVHLPLGSGVPIRVQRVDIRSVDTAGGGALVAGALLGPSATPDADAGDPSRLQDPFGTPAANLYSRAHEALLRKVVRQALESGELQRLASEERDDVRVEGADLELRPNEIRVILKARLVDACSLNKDLGFTATQIYRYSVFNGQITVTEEQDVNLDNSDVVFCVVTGLLEALIAGLAFGVIGALVDLIARIIHFIRLSPGGGSAEPLRLDGVFASELPIPGTEVLPRAETLQSRVEDLFLEANGVGTLVPDEVNTYLYLAFQRRSGLLPFERKVTPIANALVDVMDQDAPPPAGDDAAIPPSVETEHISSKRIRTTITSFEAPGSDQALARATTNSAGQARFVLPPARLRTTAGRVVTRVIIEETSTGKIISDTTTKRALIENRPDVYFRLLEADGNRLDTRHQAGGFVVNLNTRRIGAPDAPLTFTFVKQEEVISPSG